MKHRRLVTLLFTLILLLQSSLVPALAQFTIGEETPTDDEFRIYLPAINGKFSGTVVAGIYHTCVLTTAGGVKCWGWNEKGQVGDGTSGEGNIKSTPVDVVGLASRVQAIAAGREHTCVLTTAGGVKCWGDNGPGQLGDGTWENKSTPVNVVGLSSGVQAIAAGEGHTCALTMGGGVKCWGDNWKVQLGDGTWENKSTPVNVVGLSSGVQAITTGFVHTCALTTAGGVKCWGWNENGQLGDGTSGNENIRSTPVDVVGLGSGVQAIAAGGAHTCALTVGGGVKCWGVNGGGQLGDGTSGEGNIKSTPVDVVGLSSGVKAFTVGGYQSCVLITAGGVKCWGDNYYGQLGDGTTMNRNTPVEVVGLGSRVQVITGGGFHTCALNSADGVQCWGSNGYGQLGDATTENKSTPVDVVGFGGR